MIFDRSHKIPVETILPILMIVVVTVNIVKVLRRIKKRNNQENNGTTKKIDQKTPGSVNAGHEEIHF